MYDGIVYMTMCTINVHVSSYEKMLGENNLETTLFKLMPEQHHYIWAYLFISHLYSLVISFEYFTLCVVF